MTSDLLSLDIAIQRSLPRIFAVKRVFILFQPDCSSQNDFVPASLIISPATLWITGNRPSVLSNTISTYALITAVPEPSYVVSPQFIVWKNMK